MNMKALSSKLSGKGCSSQNGTVQCIQSKVYKMRLAIQFLAVTLKGGKQV